MAVYTEVSDAELSAFVARYDIGRLLSAKGIAEGVENSNFLLQTETGFFILTLYEKRVNAADLPFFIGLMEHLAGRGITCPQPVRDREGNTLQQLAGRPAAMVTFLSGMSVNRPGVAHCGELGRALAELHAAGADFTLTRQNALDLHGWRPLFEQARAQADSVSPGLAQRISDDLALLENAWPKGLPEGVIHADLFPNNVFFLGEKLSGLIDFYFACNDALAYDLAICLNAWCFEADGSFNITKGQAMISAYEAVRPLDPSEVAALPILARGAALRFLLTRLVDWLNVPPGALVKPLDPLEYDRKLGFHRHATTAADYGRVA
ncbi:homoserine kinase [Pseudochelatococcus sp. G4_1912]|uniref:homoserine kinase n=1 Tax=Pseudochelatococcus sp. G4_1912 TaxID=3114288 RepID=UPI0039C6EBE8